MTDLALVPNVTTSPFEAIKRTDAEGDYWMARDLMTLAAYVKWEKFEDAIQRGIVAIDNVAHLTRETAAQHASPRREAVKNGVPGTMRNDYRLTRHGAYMTVMNCD